MPEPSNAEPENLCRKCGAKYPDGGDGYDGMCPDCADKAEKGADVEVCASRDGRCCSCGADDPPGTEEYPCQKREDKTHCIHWYEICED